MATRKSSTERSLGLEGAVGARVPGQWALRSREVETAGTKERGVQARSDSRAKGRRGSGQSG
jgi:hypothetical protein